MLLFLFPTCFIAAFFPEKVSCNLDTLKTAFLCVTDRSISYVFELFARLSSAPVVWLISGVLALCSFLFPLLLSNKISSKASEPLLLLERSSNSLSSADVESQSSLSSTKGSDFLLSLTTESSNESNRCFCASSESSAEWELSPDLTLPVLSVQSVELLRFPKLPRFESFPFDFTPLTLCHNRLKGFFHTLDIFKFMH